MLCYVDTVAQRHFNEIMSAGALNYTLEKAKQKYEDLKYLAVIEKEKINQISKLKGLKVEKWTDVFIK